MKIDNNPLLNRERFPELPPETEAFLGVLNTYLNNLNGVVQRGIGLDNLNEETKSIKVQNNQWIEVGINSLSGPPFECRLTYWSIEDYPQFDWKILNKDRIKIRVNFVSAPTGFISIQLLIKGR